MVCPTWSLRQQLPVLRTGFVEFLYAEGLPCLPTIFNNGLDVFGDIQEGPGNGCGGH